MNIKDTFLYVRENNTEILSDYCGLKVIFQTEVTD